MYNGLLSNGLQQLFQSDFFQAVLPFLLIFTIVFAVFEKTGILGGNKPEDAARNRKYSAIIAMVMAFAVVIPHFTNRYYYGFDAVQVINTALPQVGLLLVAIVMMLLTIGLWTGKRADGSQGPGKWFTILSGIIVIGIFLGSLTRWTRLPPWLWNFLNVEVLGLIVAILVFGLIIRFIAADPESAQQRIDREKRNQEGWRNFLGGGGNT